jgi:hypothetical protein
MQKSQRYIANYHAPVVLILGLLFLPTVANADDSIDLNVRFQNGNQCRVTANYEHSGNVIVLTDDESETEQIDVEKKAKSLPLTVRGQMAYFQRTSSPEQAIRFYEVAQADIKLEKGSAQPNLSKVNRLIIARLKAESGEQLEMASISDTLDQSELDLIQNRADPLTLPRLLSKSKIKQGSKWEPANDDLAKFLGVLKVNESTLQILLKKVDDRTARLHLMGSVNADVDDVTTQMDITGIALVDRKTQMISSLKLGIQETRNPGQIAPGFEGQTRIDLRFAPDAETPELSNSAIAKYTENRKIRQRLKWESEAGHFLLTYDPRWKLIASEEEGAVFRFVDRGDLITQCSIVQLPPRPVDQPLKLEVYKQEVGKIMQADKDARLVNASQFLTPSGYTALRVIVAGQESELPINWFYYHLANQDGRQMTFVFTLEESLAKRVEAIADQLVKELQFLELPEKVADANVAPPAPTKSK